MKNTKYKLHPDRWKVMFLKYHDIFHYYAYIHTDTLNSGKINAVAIKMP